MRSESQALPDSNWAKALPLGRVPAALAALAALQSALAVRLLEGVGDSNPDHSSSLIDARAMAARLGVAESHVRTLARAGRIPFVPVGRYIKFDPVAVQAALSHSK